MQRAPIWRIATAFGCGLVAGAVLFNDSPRSAPAVAAPGEPVSLNTLATEVAVLKDKAVDQAHVMADVEYHPSRRGAR